MESTLPLRRRDLLIIGGAAGLFFSTGCAILRGGAKHPIYEKSEAALKNGVLRIPLADITPMQPGAVLEIKPGGPYPDLLLTPDGMGSFTVVTAHCTHKGCVVDHDAATSQWKCPCHGSEYSANGQVTQGPAKDPLKVPPSKVDSDAFVIDLTALAQA